jgi:aspartate-semialdehyde dehydrogenase
VALVGADTLLGRELEEVLKDRASYLEVHPFSASGEGNFAEEEGEAVYVEPLTAEKLKDTGAIIFAGFKDAAKKTYDLVKSNGGRPILFDCTGYLEDEPEGRILSPLTEPFKPSQGWLYEIAHPAASALGLVLARLSAYQKIRQIVAHVFEPVSERGKKGISELQKQTMSLLSFKPLDKSVFDAQVSFNLLSQYGEEAPTKLASVEHRIARHLTTILSRQSKQKPVPNPSLRVVHAPVFHGYSISLWIEFEGTVNANGAREALGSAQIEVRSVEDVAPDNVGSAGQSGLIAGDIRVDDNNPRALWVWVAGDNLRLTADAVTDVISELSEASR